MIEICFPAIKSFPAIKHQRYGFLWFILYTLIARELINEDEYFRK